MLCSFTLLRFAVRSGIKKERAAVSRPAPAEQDWQKIKQIYDLRGLAQLPLLLDMIRDSLDKIAPDGATLASGSYDHSVKLWQVNTGQLLQTFTGHLGLVYAVAVGPHGKYLVAAGAAGRL